MRASCFRFVIGDKLYQAHQNFGSCTKKGKKRGIRDKASSKILFSFDDAFCHFNQFS